MIFTTKKGDTFDTDKDLSEAERHILQKLFIWKEIAASVEEFRGKKQEAFRRGWNNSGPVRESPAMQKITQELEDAVREKSP